jgi:UDP-N-acetyl-D-glucosamine dehydrogenase
VPLSKVGVVGLGYVGLALVGSICKSGQKVIGLDVDKQRVEGLMAGKSPNESISDPDLARYVSTGLFEASSDPSVLKKAEIVIVAVPTPLDEQGNPEYKPLEIACNMIAAHLAPNALLINESTSHPGTLRNFIFPTIRDLRNDRAADIVFACSPERVNPGDAKFGHRNTPRVVSGLDENAKERVHSFYSSFVDEIFIASSPEVAEMSKLLENSFRLVNISFINEVSNYCVSQGIPVREVISAASTKPFGFMPFFPGPGVGGHCIPVDPAYLLKDAAEKGQSLHILDSALSLNRSRSDYILNCLEKENGAIQGKKILLVGVTYKPNVSDTRETPAKALFEVLVNKGALVSWNDPLVQFWNDSQSSVLSQQMWDITLVLVLHDKSNLEEIVQNSKLIYDLTGKIPQGSEKVRAI